MKSKYNSFLKAIRANSYEHASLKVILSCELFLDNLTAKEFKNLNLLIDYKKQEAAKPLEVVNTSFFGKPYEE